MSNFAAEMSEKVHSNGSDAAPTAAVIGFFDGVHRGHLHLVDTLLAQARQRSLRPIAVTFDRPPRQVLQPQWQPQLLTTAEERRRLLSESGLEQVVMLDFTPELAQLTAREFMQQVLLGQLGVRLLVVGYDTRFGHNLQETADDYLRYGRELGMEVVQATALEGCSSTQIRQLMAAGHVTEAAQLLGRPYTLTGTVVRGLGNGHRIGFPTANMQPDSADKIVPARGVYATRARVDDERWLLAMTDIGMRPTFSGQQLTIETHILDEQRTLYGHHLELKFCRWLRQEQRFTTPEALARQLAIDRENVMS